VSLEPSAESPKLAWSAKHSSGVGFVDGSEALDVLEHIAHPALRQVIQPAEITAASGIRPTLFVLANDLNGESTSQLVGDHVVSAGSRAELNFRPKWTGPSQAEQKPEF
jgi:hypothetical protein